MRTIDQAIRNALQKIDATNPQLRNQLYRATWQTHEKMLAELVQVAEAEKQQRREALKQIIQDIESEVKKSLSHESDSQIVTGAPTPAMRPQDSTELMSPPEMMPELVAARDEGRGASMATAREVVSKKSFLRGNGFLLVLIAILLFVGWSFYNSLIKPGAPVSSNSSPTRTVTDLIEQADAPADTAPLSRQQESEMPPQRDWIRVFDPADIGNIRTQGGAQVQLYDEGGERFMRLRTKGEGDSLLIEIGAGLMIHAGGKSAIFNVIARSATGEIAQLSVACDVGDAASCGRWRFELPPMREDLLFGVDNLDAAQGEMPLNLALTVRGGDSETEHLVDIFGLEVSFDE